MMGNWNPGKIDVSYQAVLVCVIIGFLPIFCYISLYVVNKPLNSWK